MIKINLALGKQPAVARDSTRQTKFLNIDLKDVDFEKLKELPVARILIPLGIIYVAGYVLDFYKDERIKQLNIAEEKLKAESTKWQADLVKFREFDIVKKELDSDEIAIKNKLDIIHQLVENRNKVNGIIFNIASLIPENVWLDDITLRGGDLKMKGHALEYSQISDFMKNMTESRLFKNVELKEAIQVKDKDVGNDIESFELLSNLR